MSLLSTKVAFLELLPTHVLYFDILHIFWIIILITSPTEVREKCMYLLKQIRSSKKVRIVCAIKGAKKQTNILILQFQ